VNRPSQQVFLQTKGKEGAAQFDHPVSRAGLLVKVGRIQVGCFFGLPDLIKNSHEHTEQDQAHNHLHPDGIVVLSEK